MRFKSGHGQSRKFMAMIMAVGVMALSIYASYSASNSRAQNQAASQNQAGSADEGSLLAEQGTTTLSDLREESADFAATSTQQQVTSTASPPTTAAPRTLTATATSTDEIPQDKIAKVLKFACRYATEHPALIEARSHIYVEVESSATSTAKTVLTLANVCSQLGTSNEIGDTREISRIEFRP